MQLARTYPAGFVCTSVWGDVLWGISDKFSFTGNYLGYFAPRAIMECFVFLETTRKPLCLNNGCSVHQMKVQVWRHGITGMPNVSEVLVSVDFLPRAHTQGAATGVGKKCIYLFIPHFDNYVVAQHRPKISCLLWVERH